MPFVFVIIALLFWTIFYSRLEKKVDHIANMQDRDYRNRFNNRQNRSTQDEIQFKDSLAAANQQGKKDAGEYRKNHPTDSNSTQQMIICFVLVTCGIIYFAFMR